MPKPKVKFYIPAVQTYSKILGLLPKSNVQTLIDTEVVRLSDPYVPSDTTAIRKSVFINTDFGSGKIEYDIYGNVPGRNTWNDTTSEFQDRPRRGPFWTIRMWNDGGKEKVIKTINRFLKKKS